MEDLVMYRRSIKLFTFLRSLFSMADKMYGAVFILHMNFIGLSPLEISSVFAIASISLAIFDYPTGIISDKIGRKKTAGLGYLVIGFGMITFAICPNYYLVLSSQIIISLGIALLSGAPIAWIMGVMKKTNTFAEKDRIFPKISTIAQSFGILGAFLSIFIVKISFVYALLVVGSINIILGVVALCYLPDNKGRVEGNNFLENLVDVSKKCLRDKNMKFLLLNGSLSQGGFLIFMLSWQIYLVDVLGKSSSYIGILMTVFMGIIMLGNLITVKLSKKMKSINISILAKVIVAVGFLLVFMKENFYFYLVGIFLFEIGYGMNSAASIWFEDYVPEELRSSYSSAYSALISLSGFFLSIFIGLLINNFGYNFIWLVAFFFQMGTTLVLTYISRNKLEENICTVKE